MPPGWVIVAHFYDVESGRKELDERGNSLAHRRFNIPIPRDGSISDLLEEAQCADRRFAAVICESIERVARRTYFGTKIEYELEQAGVALCAADEPIVTGRGAKRATPTLTRRVKQAVSEWYVLQMLELSWDGFVEHTNRHGTLGSRRTVTCDNEALLDALPYLDVDLTRVPEEKQRQLYEAFGLEVRYSRAREELGLRVTIPGHAIDALASITRGLDAGNKETGASIEVLAPDHGTRVLKTGRNSRSYSPFLGAPGRIRTCAHGSGGRCSIP